MDSLIDLLWSQLIGFDLWNFYVSVFNYYFPFGSFFWMVGIVIFIVMDLKTKSLPYASGMMAIFFVIISTTPNLVINAYSMMAMRYVGLIIGAVSGYYIYKELKG